MGKQTAANRIEAQDGADWNERRLTSDHGDAAAAQVVGGIRPCQPYRKARGLARDRARGRGNGVDRALRDRARVVAAKEEDRVIGGRIGGRSTVAGARQTCAKDGDASASDVKPQHLARHARDAAVSTDNHGPIGRGQHGEPKSIPRIRQPGKILVDGHQRRARRRPGSAEIDGARACSRAAEAAHAVGIAVVEMPVRHQPWAWLVEPDVHRPTDVLCRPGDIPHPDLGQVTLEFTASRTNVIADPEWACARPVDVGGAAVVLLAIDVIHPLTAALPGHGDVCPDVGRDAR